VGFFANPGIVGHTDEVLLCKQRAECGICLRVVTEHDKESLHHVFHSPIDFGADKAALRRFRGFLSALVLFDYTKYASFGENVASDTV